MRALTRSVCSISFSRYRAGTSPMTSLETADSASFCEEVSATVLDSVMNLIPVDSPMYAVAAGPGKKLRGQLVREAALATGRQFAWSDVVNLAAAVELLHLGSLIHDDVVDGAEVRRGVDVTASDSRAAEARLLDGLACVH